MISILQSIKGFDIINKMWVKLRCLFSAHRLMLPYICTIFRENISLWSGHDL